MTLYDHPLYREDLEYVCSLPIDWERVAGKTFVISGASGNIAGFLIDVLKAKDPSTRIYALGRNKSRAAARFRKYFNDENFIFVEGDINEGINIPASDPVKPDYVLHAASNTHPVDYSRDPIGTVTTNVLGTYKLLEFAAERGCGRFIYASSVEIYGENRGDIDRFRESDLGYIDCNTMRAGYPESKRCGEALCQAYIAAKNMDIVIPRLSRTYGPTLLSTDTKAISQFIHKGVQRENIVLKSKGDQLYSYNYVADAVAGLLYCLLYGEKGAAYNIADPASDITLKELASIVAKHAGKEVVFELPDAREAAGYSTATKALLDASKLRALGWSAHYDMRAGLERTVDVLRDINCSDT